MVFSLRGCTFMLLLARDGLPNIRFHDPRRTCATLLLTKGVHPRIVSEVLGHSSVSITLVSYSHIIPGLGTQQRARWRTR